MATEGYDEELYETDDEYEEEEEEEYESGEEESGEDVDDGEVDWEAAKEWQGQSVLPAPTWKRLVSMVGQMSSSGHREMTILLLGKPGCGRSSTANSLLCEAAADVRPGNQGPSGAGVDVYIRKHGDFLLKVIDTPNLVSGNKVNVSAFEDIARSIGSRRVDVMLYVDRLDVVRIDPLDYQVWRAISNHFGKQLWKRAVVCLTRGSMSPPAGYDYEQFVQRRSEQIGGAMQRAGARDVPVVVVENSSMCSTNDNKEKTLPDGTVWLASLMQELVNTTSAFDEGHALRFHQYNPNRRNLWLIPFLVAAQWALKKYVVDPVIEADGWRGDKNGEFDAETAREERLLAETRKRQQRQEADAAQKRREQTRARDQSGRSTLNQAASSGYKSIRYADDIDDDLEDEYAE